MTRRVVVTAIDILILGAASLTVLVIVLGGFVAEFADLQISFRTPSRTLLWTIIGLIVRLIVDRSTGLFGLAFLSPSRFPPLSPDADLFHARPAAGAGWRVAFAALGIGLVLAMLVQEQLQFPYSVADYGDPLFSIWRIGWVQHQLGADPARLFDANIFYPQPLALTLSDPVILPALTAAPLAAIGTHPVPAYNLLLLSGFWFSGIATYLLVERLTASPAAGFISGLMYACYPYRFEHYGHLELQMTQWMPLGLLALHLFIASGRWRYAIALGLAGVAQLYSAMYYAVFFLLYAGAVGAGLVLAQRPPIRRLLLPAAAAALLAGLVAIPLARTFVAAQPLKPARPIEEIRYYSATPRDYVRAHSRSVLWKDRMLPLEPERALFPGLAPLVLGAIGAAPPVSAVRLVYIGALLFSLDCSLGFNGASYPLLYRAFPPVRGLRVPARFSVLVGLTLSILAGFGVRRILGWCQSRMRKRVVLVALGGLVAIDAWPSLALVPVWKEPPAIYDTLKGRRGVVLAEFPVDANEVFNLPYMYFSVWHWTPMVNGYSGHVPEFYTASVAELLQFPRGDTVARLRRRGVTHVTVNCALYDCAPITALTQQSPELRMIAETRWEGSSVQLLELTRP